MLTTESLCRRRDSDAQPPFKLGWVAAMDRRAKWLLIFVERTEQSNLFIAGRRGAMRHQRISGRVLSLASLITWADSVHWLEGASGWPSLSAA